MAQAIAEGQPDLHDTGIVLVRRSGSQLACSGTILERNLVLTARHCVSRYGHPDAPDISCGRTAFQGATEPAGLVVSVGADAASPTQETFVQEVWFSPGDGGFCDNDHALLLLDPPLDLGEVQPLAPRLDTALVAGEEYAAVGFGATSDSGAGFGLRRRRDGLSVDCVGPGCGVPDVGPREWQGLLGTCRGDSGGPAIDGQGRLVGVASRAAARCETPIYSDVFSLRAWLIESAISAAEVGEYPAPDWTLSAPQSTEANLAPAPSGCQVAPPTAISASAFWLVGWLLVRHRRLRRPR